MERFFLTQIISPGSKSVVALGNGWDASLETVGAQLGFEKKGNDMQTNSGAL